MEKIRTVLAAFILVGGIACMPGCGTIYSQRDYWINPGSQEGIVVLDGLWVYGGTLNDVNLLFQLFGLPLIDLPLSLALDTALLPLTIPQQIVGRPSGQPEGADESDQTDD